VNKYVIALFINTILITSVFAEEEYKPIFPTGLPAQSKNSILNEYENAASSRSVKIAISAWEAFLAEYTYGDPSQVEDLTALLFIRQAHFELARLYYLQGNIISGDDLMRQINGFNIYSSPEISNGKRWCKTEGYCQ